MSELADVARFGANERAEIVTASFICPRCLHIDCDGTISGSGDETEVACHCAQCDTEWTLGIDGWQAMRLLLSPPPAEGEGWRLRLQPSRRQA